MKTGEADIQILHVPWGFSEDNCKPQCAAWGLVGGSTKVHNFELHHNMAPQELCNNWLYSAHENSISVLQHSTQNITVYHIVICLFTLGVHVIKPGVNKASLQYVTGDGGTSLQVAIHWGLSYWKWWGFLMLHWRPLITVHSRMGPHSGDTTSQSKPITIGLGQLVWTVSA